ncbi:uncharacterized protein HHUB_2199 [Halobacterium hubeiense]|uniref:Antitoxin SocA-like Panacea domain-containing protein n=1 Tax=Halobacterium hubeiense TaxID=1407499 RepID=A0A0U5GZX2_9EURY|nr:hypothetical protein [Halobacterium hubeiense]CQH55209.1 uncharacterized protein HHUB_2199 [Halobacterium hubeiense]
MARIDEIDRRTDVVFILFYFAEQVRGVTKLQKLLFLIEQETEFFEEYEDDVAFEFAPYKMGPFSEAVYSELEFLLQLSAIESEPLDSPHLGDESQSDLGNKKFSITPKGEKIASELVGQLEPEYRDELENLVTEYNSMSLTELLQYVYSTYPDFAVESEIRDDVFSEAK